MFINISPCLHTVCINMHALQPVTAITGCKSRSDTYSVASVNSDISFYCKLEKVLISLFFFSAADLETVDLAKPLTRSQIKLTIYKTSNLLQFWIKDSDLKKRKKFYFQSLLLFVNTINCWLFAHTP